ncbi:MAG: hypothetical protein ACE37K_18825 [Planctomycetota bacterium]
MSSTRETSTAATACCALLLAAACSAPPAPVANQNSPPQTAQVRDGLGPDVDTQQRRTSLFANWDAFVDPEGQPVVYEWSVGTQPGATDVLDWREAAGAQRAAIGDIQLPIGVMLHVNVRARDVAGNRSAVASSDGVVVGETVDRTAAVRPQPGIEARPGHFGGLDRNGISWTFARPARCGRYVNGDWWVVGPVDVVAIKPESLRDGSRVRHGSMVNPSPAALTQGYDNAMFGDGAGGRYSDAANAALGVSRQQPLSLRPGSSLVSTVSHPTAGQLPQLDRCAVLTVVDEPPSADAFRPPYCGTDKRARWSADALDLTRFARLEPVPGAPSIGELVARFEQTWLDHLPGFTGRYLHPRENMPDYGRDIADLVSTGALALHLELPSDDKRALLIAMVQVGIDVYGIVDNGGRFVADGGSGSGRKFPLMLAGTVLDDEHMLKLAAERKFAFGEDAQTFYVERTSPGVVNGGHGGYGSDDLGLPEWGNRHADDPSLDRKAWTADPYRRCCTANVWHGFVLAARILGMREAWDHAPLFDYVDRYMQVEQQGHWMRGYSPFCERMWDRYRRDF